MERNPRILVVDDDEGSRLALSTLILDEGYEVETASNGADALQCIDEHPIDLVVSDVQMPGLGGFEVVRRLRRNLRLRDLPVILVSGQANPDRRTKGRKADAADFMVKPLDFDALLARIQTQLRCWRRIREQRHQLVSDPLARILSPSGISKVLAEFLKDAQEDESFTSVLMIAPNHGTKANGTRGPMPGQDVLRTVAEDLQTSLRFSDTIGRLGSGEFLVVLANTNLEDARGLAQRLRNSPSIALLAIGVATSRGSGRASLLMQKAEEHMRRDKRM